jgi:hypothetical protein
MSMAQQLRERSLEMIEKWKEEYGKECPQVTEYDLLRRMRSLK